jgi:hypothetical protein
MHVKANLNGLFLVVGDFVYLIEGPGLKKYVSRLARHHSNEPPHETSCRGIHKYQPICNQKAYCANEMERLIDAALVIQPMIIPLERTDFVDEIVHVVFL